LSAPADRSVTPSDSLQALLEWQQAVLGSSTLHDLVRHACSYPGANGHPAAVSLMIVDATHEFRHLLLGGAAGEPPDHVSFVESLYAIAPQFPAHDEPWVGAYCPADHGLLFRASDGLRHVAMYPLFARGALVGALNLASRGSVDDVASPIAWLRRHVGVIAGGSLERLLDRARLLRTGVSDSVAGWHSRVYFQGRLREEIARCQRRGGTLVCVLVDVDGLRSVNDRHGQVAGDVVLAEVAERLQAHIRASDSAAHLGGDEFAIILPDTAIGQATPLMERVLRAMRAAPVKLANGQELPLTVSIGVAALRPSADADRKTAADHLLARASAALHRAKFEGRDRYSVATGA